MDRNEPNAVWARNEEQRVHTPRGMSAPSLNRGIVGGATGA